MAEIVKMPRLSDTMEEGVVAKWHKNVGDKVEEGDLLAEIETDKATMEFESFQEGVLLYQGIAEGDGAPVDSVLAILGEEGEDYKAALEADGSADDSSSKEESKEEPKEEKKEEPKEEKTSAQAESSSSSSSSSSTPSGRIKASPLAKKLAEEKGVNLSQVSGSGEGGRIVKRDIDSFQAPAAGSSAQAEQSSAPAFQYVAAPAGEEKYEEQKVSQMRKTIAKRLAESKFSAPHFYLTLDIDMDRAIEARKSMNASGKVKISFNDLVVKAVAMALRQHPVINSSWRGDTIRINQHVNIGVAVAVDEGLLVPVLRYADTKGLAQISSEVKDFVGKAKDKKLQPADWEGSTFTTSNLGMFGIEECTAIINPPDSCIMTIGGIKQVPVVKNGEVVPGNVMKVTLSCDHRVVDGASGAAFLQTFKEMMEDPIHMLL